MCQQCHSHGDQTNSNEWIFFLPFINWKFEEKKMKWSRDHPIIHFSDFFFLHFRSFHCSIVHHQTETVWQKCNHRYNIRSLEFFLTLFHLSKNWERNFDGWNMEHGTFAKATNAKEVKWHLLRDSYYSQSSICNYT